MFEATQFSTTGEFSFAENSPRFLQTEEITMKRFTLAAICLVVIACFTSTTAFAGSPHFVGACVATRSGNTLTVSGKEAGLGDESQINVVISATALCINGGGNHPKATNKTSVSAAGTFPVQNGKALFSLDATATFSPSCNPPMTVSFVDITVTDQTNSITCTVSGP